jgi:PAS domain S-box-containing protein
MTPPDGTAIVGSYDNLTAVLSILIAVLASYTALDLGERVTAARGAARIAWLISGAIAMGIGIWSMHYTGMLAYRLPVPVLYHWPTVLLSLLAGIFSSAIALFAVSRQRLGSLRALAGSISQGAGIATLHYTGMAAMRLPGMCHYSPAIATLSVLFAIAGSLLSLWLTFLFRDEPAGRRLRKAASALLMGAAISVMHYTAMAAASFTAFATVPNLSRAVRVTSLGIAGIVTVTVMVLVGAVVTALVDRLQERSALLEGLFEQAPQAVALMNVANRVVRVNRQFTRLFGYAPQETLGRRLSELIVPSELRDDLQRNAEVVSQENGVDLEAVRQRKDGSRLNVHVVSVPVSVPNGHIAVFAMYRDITERKAAEAALQALSTRLLEVQENERRHLARELHDEIGQLLTGLRLLLRLNGDSPADALKARFEHARTIVDDLLGRVRRLSFDLRPADLDQLGLLPALLALFERYTAQTGVLVNFKHQGVEMRFAPEVETGAYRIVQEALTNAARHAGVAGVTVRVWTDAERLNLQIEDQGRGFDPEGALKAPRSSGLIGMQERITLLGGRMSIESSPGAGTTITAELPLDYRKPGAGS